MGFENIWRVQGLQIAATGMSIVFIALTLISVFIAALPRVLTWLGDVPPSDHAPAPLARSVDEEVVVAIGYVLHQIELQKRGPS